MNVMLVRKNSEWVLYPNRVTYKERGEEKEDWALPSREWWETTCEKHDHLELIGFEEIELTDEQLNRFDEIRDMPNDFVNVYIEYVRTGVFLNEDLPKRHPFITIFLQKENEKQGQMLIDAELENISQGQELTDLDLRLLELEAK